MKVELVSAHGSDKLIAQGAWTCTGVDADTRGNEDVSKVIRFLVAEGHASPLEFAGFTWLIRCDIATDRQLVTYRAAKRNGESMRYHIPAGDFLDLPDDVKDILYENSLSSDVDFYAKHCEEAYRHFTEVMEQLKKLGVSKDEYRRVRECYRRVLPLATNVNRFIQMDVRNFANFLYQRLSPHAQPEIREVAKQMLAVAIETGTCPIALEALAEKGWKI
jgi:flavin-dependent thymidylate synthase